MIIKSEQTVLIFESEGIEAQPKTIEEVFSNWIDSGYGVGELDWGEDVGREYRNLNLIE